MFLTTLVDTKTLASHVGDPGFVIVDCRFNLDDTSLGEREYHTGHIPGAAYVSLDRDLSGPKTSTSGRHPLPDPAELRETFSRLGISDGVQVVAYDQDTGAYASRFWWMLRWMGHDAVAVLDGGLAKWIAEKRPITSGDEIHARREFGGAPRSGWVMTVDDVARIVGDPKWKLVDARAPERFSGAKETIDKAAGHIPGALNYFFKSNLDEHGVIRSPEEIRTQVRDAVGATPPDRIVAYCGSGVTACQNLLAFEHAGIHGAKLYPGSWSEWSSDPARKIEKS